MKPIGKDEQPPVQPPPKRKSSFFGHIYDFFFEKKMPQEAKKVHRFVITKPSSDETEILRRSKEDIENRYQANLKIVLETQDFDTLQVTNQSLNSVSKETDPKMKEDVENLVQQVYRQAWGRLIDADHGYRVKEEELANLNQLKTHLNRYYPQGIPKGSAEKPLKILSSTYKTSRLASEGPDEEIQKGRKIQSDVEEKVETIRKNQLSSQSLIEGEKGVSEAKFQVVEGKKVALTKKMEEKEWASAVADMLGETNDTNIAALDVISGMNESLASSLDVLLEGHLGIPLVLGESTATTHAFVENKGNYFDAKKKNKNLDKKLVGREAQRFVFSELITGNTDCHSGNILIDPNDHPIPIDFGRILPPDPLNHWSLIRSDYFNFGCMEEEINEEDKTFFSELPIDETISKLREQLYLQYASQLKNPAVKKALDKSLIVLEARLIMIQEGVKEGLNQLQLLSLDLPPLPNAFANQIIKTSDQSLKMIDLSMHANKFGFRKAFKEATKSNKFEPDIFRNEIKKEIEQKKGAPFFQLFDNPTKKAYRSANLI